MIKETVATDGSIRGQIEAEALASLQLPEASEPKDTEPVSLEKLDNSLNQLAKTVHYIKMCQGLQEERMQVLGALKRVEVLIYEVRRLCLFILGWSVFMFVLVTFGW